MNNKVSFLLFALMLNACGHADNGGMNLGGENSGAGTKYLLSVSLAGTGSGKVTSQPNGIDCGSACSASLTAGTDVTLTASPSPGSRFSGWSGSCTGKGACDVVADDAKAVTARFNLSTIVFSSSRKLDGADAPNANRTSNIWRVNADGSGLTPLTNTTANEAHSNSPQWSPDGSKVVFVSSRKVDGTDAPNSNLTSNIWRVNADGIGPQPLTNATANLANSYSPQWSPDGSKVVFSSSRNLDGTDSPTANLTLNIWRVNTDGTEMRFISNVTAGGANSDSPHWSPDASTVVFHSARRLDGTDAANANLTSNIWRLNADGTNPKPLTNATRVHGSGPQWSPDGSKVVFYSQRKLDGTDDLGLANNIWSVNTDGTSLRPITNARSSGADSYSAQWSPDGSKVVFVSSRNLDGADAPNANGTQNIWRANADGTGLIPLTRATAIGAGSGEPEWSPDGSKVVFHSSRKLDGADAPNTNGTYNIWCVNADGTGLTPITHATASGADSRSPSFSP